MRKIVVTIGVALLPGAADAHPEHGSGGDFGLIHFLTDPFHVVLTAAAILLFLVARRALVRRRSIDSSAR